MRAWTILLGVCAIILGMAAGGFVLIRSAFHPGRTWDDSFYNLILALGLLAPLLFIVWHFIRIKLRTGRWAGDKQEKDERLRQIAQRRSAQSLAINRARPLPWGRYIVLWASYAAFESSYPLWQRTAGWTVLSGYALYLLALTAIGAVCIGASFAEHNTLRARLLFIGLGLLLFLIPGMAVRNFVRRMGAGRLCATRDELAETQARRTAWRVRESEKPLRSKLITCAFLVLLYAAWWIRVTVHRAQHPHQSWIGPALGTPGLLYLIWSQFRRPKTSAQPTGPDA